jgi:hypothetical protein
MNFSCILFLLLPIACAAQSIQGSVYNATTGRAEPAHQVILFTPAGEQARATTDEYGAFSIRLPKELDARALTILQVVHDGVDYYQPIHLGEKTIAKVYEASNRVGKIKAYLSILQFQSKGTSLQVTELHAIDNASSPPRTKVSPDNLVLSIPQGAQVSSAVVSMPDGSTLQVPLVAIPGRTGLYRLGLPLKPGRTKYAISYEVPYTNKFIFRRQSQYPIGRLGIIIPESMGFRLLSAQPFRMVADQPRTQERIFDHLAANQIFAFEISGTGSLSRSFEPRWQAKTPKTSMVGLSNQPASSGPSLEAITHHNQKRSTSVWLPLTLAVSVVGLFAMLLWTKILKGESLAESPNPIMDVDSKANPDTSSLPRNLVSQSRRH